MSIPAPELTAARHVLDAVVACGCTLAVEGASLVVRPAGRLPAWLRAAIVAHSTELANLIDATSPRTVREPSANPRTDDAQAVRYRDTLARLRRWGWPAHEAEAMARRIALRHADDDRSTCVECTHARPGRCANHRTAGLGAADLGRDLAATPQRCPGYSERGEER